MRKIQVLDFKFKSGLIITVEANKLIPLLRKEFPAKAFLAKKDVELLPKIYDIGHKKVLDFMKDELDITLPTSAEQDLQAIEPDEIPDTSKYEEDNHGSEEEMESNITGQKHISKMTKTELELELGKLGIPYVYGSTKDAARALVAIKEGRLKPPSMGRIKQLQNIHQHADTTKTAEKVHFQPENVQNLNEENYSQSFSKQGINATHIQVQRRISTTSKYLQPQSNPEILQNPSAFLEEDRSFRK